MITNEIWVNAITGGLFGENTVLAKSVNHSSFINGRTVHVPNAGAPAEIVKNTKSLPLTVKERQDIDLSYNIDNFKITPMVIPSAEQVELSYDKRTSIVAENRAKLLETITSDTVANWIKGAKIGDAVSSVKELVRNAAKQFDTDKVPQADRYVMLSAENYYKLLDELTEQEQFAFSATANASEGTLGKYYGMQVVSEFFLPPGIQAFAWQKQSVSSARSALQLFSNDKDATYFGDVVSGEMRAGGAIIRSDKKGAYVINQIMQPVHKATTSTEDHTEDHTEPLIP